MELHGAIYTLDRTHTLSRSMMSLGERERKLVTWLNKSRRFSFESLPFCIVQISYDSHLDALHYSLESGIVFRRSWGFCYCSEDCNLTLP